MKSRFQHTTLGLNKKKSQLTKASLSTQSGIRFYLWGLLLLLITLSIPTNTFSANITISGTTNWSTITTGSGTSGQPSAADAITLSNGARLTVNVANAVCGSITISGGNTTTYITISGTNTLTVSGAITINAPTQNNRPKYILVNGGTLNAGSISIASSGSTKQDSYVSIATGTLNVTGNIQMSGTGGINQLAFTDAGTINIGGTITGGAISNSETSATTLTRGVVNYNNNGNQSIGDYSYNDLTLSGSGTKTLTSSTAQTANVLTVTANTTLSLDGSNSLTPASASIGGTVTVSNTASIVKGSGNLVFNTGSTYNHNRNGGTIPTGSWDVNATCLISGVTNTVPGGLTQSFGNFTWNSTSQTANLNLAGGLTTVTGDLTMTSTGSGTLSVGGSETGNLTIANYIQTGGTFRGNYAQATGVSRTITISGNLSISGGIFDLSAATNSAYSVLVNLAGNFTHTGGTITETGAGTNNRFLFNGTSSQTFTSGGTISNTVNFSVNSGAILQMASATTTVTGGGYFTVSAGGTLGIRATDGIASTGATGHIRVTGTRTFTAGAHYIYNGTTGAQITGTGLTQNTPANLTINNSNGVSLSAATTMSGILTLSSGILTASNTLILTSTSASAVTGGSATSYVNGILRRYLAPSLTASSSYFFPTGNASGYYPFTLSNITTGTGTITAQIQAFTANSGGSIDSSLGSKSSTEYWYLVTAGNFTSGSASIVRPTAISPYNVIASSTTQTGTYTNLYGNSSTYGVDNSNTFSGSGNRYFTFGKYSGTYFSPTSLSGFTYQQNLGPSTVKTLSVGGLDLTSNIRLEMKYGKYEMSLSNTTYTGYTAINLPVSGSKVSPTNIYVRLKAGYTEGSHLDTIFVSSTGYTTKSIPLSGTITTAASLTVSPSSLTFNSYNYGAGPSNILYFDVSGSNLVYNTTVTPPSDFEIATTSGGTYQSTALTYTPANLATAQRVYVRMKAGQSSGAHTSNIVVASTGATSKTVTCNGNVNPQATIRNSTSFMGAFVYSGTGPSAVQAFELKVNDLASGSTIKLAPPASGNFEVARTRTSTSYSTDTIFITNVSGNFTDSVFVRLKAGLSVGDYINQSLTIKASGAVTKSVGLNGKVVSAATISSSVKDMTGFGYQYSAGTPTGISAGGPSQYQTFVISGVLLGSSVTTTVSSDFEISKSANGTYSSTLNYNTVSTTLYPTTIYVRLKAGKGTGTYTGTITVTDGVVNTIVNLKNARVYQSPVISTDSDGDYCTGSAITLNSTGADVLNQFWEGPNSFYSTEADPQLTTSATASLSGNYVVTGNVIVGGNLIYNGGFEDGFVGFGSSYNYRDSTYSSGSSYGALYNEADYTIVTIPRNVHTNFTNQGPIAGKKQMVVNGASIAGVVIWSQAVSVIPGAKYQFTYFEQNVCNPSPSQLQLYINGVSAGPIYTASSTVGLWTEYLYNASAGTNSLLNLELVNQNTAANGNDFALDSIEFKQILAATDTATIVVGSAANVSVSLAASQNPVNSGIPVTYTATPTNGGLYPTYSWKVNGTSYPAVTGSTFTYTPQDGDTIKCTLTSSLNCVTGNPATTYIKMTVNTVVTPNYWIGRKSTVWSDTRNWTNYTVPEVGEDVEFATLLNNDTAAINDLYVDDSRIIGNLINKSAKRLIIPADTKLTVNYNITTNNNADQIVIKTSSTLPNGTLIFNNSVNNPVYATVEMYSKAFIDKTQTTNNGKYKWQYFGIPVQSVVAETSLSGCYVREWKETGDSITNHWVSLSDNSVLQPFIGYEICQPSAKIVTFKGALNNSNFNSNKMAYTTTALYPGQHFYANSYTSAIDIRQVEFGQQTNATIYLYSTGSYNDWLSAGSGTSDDENPGQYRAASKTYAGLYGIPRQIPSMQGFLVMASSNSTDAYLSINYTSVAMENSSLMRSKSQNSNISSDASATVIQLSGQTLGDKMWLFTDKSSTKSFDNGMDSQKLLGTAMAPQIFAVETDGSYQINAVPDINNSTIAFQAGVDTQYTLQFNHNNQSKYYAGIYLVDNETNTVTDITKDSSEYHFSATTTAQPVERFKIVTRYYDLDELEKKTDLNIFSASGTIFVQNKSNLSASAVVYDLFGRYIAKLNIPENGGISQITNLTKGAYVVKAYNSAEENGKRVIVF